MDKQELLNVISKLEGLENKTVLIYGFEDIRLSHIIKGLTRVYLDGTAPLDLQNVCYILVDNDGRYLRLSNDFIRTSKLTIISNIFENKELLEDVYR